ncbi:hypothetical protein UlMin_022560, partial [Ulmus minor]
IFDKTSVGADQTEVEPPPKAKSFAENSNSKKPFDSWTSSHSMDPDVVEIPPPLVPPPSVPRTRRMPKNKDKEVIRHDVIDLDKYDDSVDVMFLDEAVDKNNKGKAIQNHQSEEHMQKYFGSCGMEASKSVNGFESSNSFDLASHNFDLDDLSSDLIWDDDDGYSYFLAEDFMDIDEHAKLQALFDKADIPTGIEAPIPWMVNPKSKSVSGSSSVQTVSQKQLNANSPHGMNSLSSAWSSQPAHLSRKKTTMSSSSLQIHDLSQFPEMDVSSPSLLSQSSQSKKKSANLQHKGASHNLPLGLVSPKPRWRKPHSKKKPDNSSSSANYSVDKFDAMKLPSEADPPFADFFPEFTNEQAATSNFYSCNYTLLGNKLSQPASVGPYLPSSPAPQPSLFSAPQPSLFSAPQPSMFSPLGSVYHPHMMTNKSWFEIQNHQMSLKNATAPDSSTDPIQAISREERDEIMRKFQAFKQFDTVEDHSDHQYTTTGSSKAPVKNCAKRIQEEWKILEKDLPETIFVRVYESRMELMRAVIVGAEGTPYHDGLFFFDVFFPCGYPNAPPHVYYHSGGLRLNPNLYKCGKVCLSLLNTWHGQNNEKWIPGTSTMLQVLVSIQGLILNTKPYFNEPGYAPKSGSAAGELSSQKYNEDIFILSLKTMMYTMRRPPKHFEDFVLGHFINRAHDILVACKAYMDGAQVGCLVKGGVQDLDAGDKSCSKNFRDSLAKFVPTLVKEFTRIGVEDCENFYLQLFNSNKQMGDMSQGLSPHGT